MVNRNRRRMLVLCALAGLAVTQEVSPALAGYTLTTLGAFNGSDGTMPVCALALSNGTLYGTTYSGGATNSGTVFSLPVTGGNPIDLTSFNVSNNVAAGEHPAGGVILSGNTLYGTKESGGTYGQGTVFSLPIAGGTPTLLTTFTVLPGSGENPTAALVQSGGTLYGTTSEGGGGSNLGTVFSLPVTGGSATTLAAFNSSTGDYLTGGVILSGSTLFGTTEFSYGGVFSLPVAGGTPTALATFNSSSGMNPEAGVILSGNTLYGTTERGGTNNDGIVFAVPVTGGTPTVLANLDSTSGTNPYGTLSISGNTLYGAASAGGAGGDGTVFSLPITGGTPTVMVAFNGSNGSDPVAGLTVSGDTIYGTTNTGGANNDGTVFALSPTVVPEPTGLLIFAPAALLLRSRHRK